MAKRSSKILVLGSGFPAEDIAEELSAERLEIDLLERGASRSLAGRLARACPATIVHTARSLSPRLPRRPGAYDPVVAKALAAALSRWLDAGGRLRSLIALSSTAVYGTAIGSPLAFTESGPLGEVDPASDFGRWVSELRESEAVLGDIGKSRGFAVTLLRAAPLVGGCEGGALGDYLSHTVPLRVLGYDPPFQLLHSSDLVTAVVAAADVRHNGPLNITGRGTVPLSRLGALAGKPALPVPARLAAFLAPRSMALERLMRRCVADNARAHQVLGFTPRYSAEEALAEL